MNAMRVSSDDSNDANTIAKQRCSRVNRIAASGQISGWSIAHRDKINLGHEYHGAIDLLAIVHFFAKDLDNIYKKEKHRQYKHSLLEQMRWLALGGYE